MTRMYNPSAKVFVLFGGACEMAPLFEKALHGLCDDFWLLDDKPAAVDDAKLDQDFRGGVQWKWYYGCLVLLEWYKKRGHDLNWDTVFVLQWDLLVFSPIEKIFTGLKKDQVFFSGRRRVEEVEELWSWTSPDFPTERRNYVEFLEYAEKQFGYTGEPTCCLAIVMLLPKVFFEKFASIPRPEIGFLEYKFPTYADMFELEPFTGVDPDVWWDDLEPHSWKGTLHAITVDIEPLTILLERCRPRGARMFHPYSRSLPDNYPGWTRLVIRSARRVLSGCLANWNSPTALILKRVKRRLARGLSPRLNNVAPKDR
jgi:hypothetical protein